MPERSWTVVGYEAGERVFEQTISVDSIAESDVKALLQRLAARGLSEADVVSASLVSEQRSAHLDVTETDGDGFGFTTDQSAPRYYVAILGEAA